MTRVTLHLYDLSNGMARSMSMAMLGKQLDGIWHSGIVVFGVEYFYGGGICAAPAGRAIPHLTFQEISLGATTKTQVELENFLQSINHRFTQATYSLLRHNCNNFANEVSMFLLGKGIPEHIIKLPQEFLTSPMGAALAPMIEGMEQRMREELVGHGRGLNPFGHIQGRVPLFPANPSIAPSESVPQITSNPDTRDTGLLRTAVGGIPDSIMSAEMKDRVVKLDESVVHDLVVLMKAQLKDKKPILLTFNTIISFFWGVRGSKEELMKETTGSLLADLVTMSLESQDSHIVTAGLSTCVHVSAAPNEQASAILLGEALPRLRGIKAETKSKLSAIVEIRINCLEKTVVSQRNAKQYIQLLKECIELFSVLSSSNAKALVPQYLDAIETASGKCLEESLGDSVKSEIESIMAVTVAEEAQDSFEKPMPQLLRLVLE